MGRSLMNVTVCESHRACFLLLFLLQHCWTFYFLHFPSEQFRSWNLSGTSSSCVKPPAGLSLSLSFFSPPFLDCVLLPRFRLLWRSGVFPACSQKCGRWSGLRTSCPAPAGRKWGHVFLIFSSNSSSQQWRWSLNERKRLSGFYVLTLAPSTVSLHRSFYSMVLSRCFLQRCHNNGGYARCLSQKYSGELPEQVGQMAEMTPDHLNSCQF